MPAEFIGRLRSWEAAPLLLAVAGFLLAYSFYTPHQPLTSPDSQSYLDFSPERSGGYPLFLSMLRAAGFPLAKIPVAQLVLYALSVLLFCLALLRCLGRPPLIWLCAVTLLFNFEVNRYHFSILSESLFLSVSALFLAAAVGYLRLGSLASLAAASTFVGILIAIRPVGLAFIPAFVVLAFCVARPERQSLLKIFLAGLLPLVAVAGLEWGYYRAHHSAPRQSLAPIHILAKAGLADAPGASSAVATAPAAVRPLMEALESTLAPVRALIAGAPSEAARCQLLANYEVFVQYQFAPELRQLATAVQGDRALASIGAERLKYGIVGYLRGGLDHLFCMWTLGALTEQERMSLQVYLQAHRPLPFEDQVIPAMSNIRLPPAALLVRWTMLGIAALLAAAALTLVAVLSHRGKPSATLAIAGLCGMTVHATLLLTALTGVGIPRYVLALWIPLALSTVLSVAWLWDVFIRRAREWVR